MTGFHMRNMLWVWIVLGCCHAAFAGSVAVVTPAGDVAKYLAIPSSRLEQIDPSRLENLPADQPLDWRVALRERVTETERLMRCDPPANADKLEQSRFQTEINEKIYAQFKDLPGKVVDVPFVVEKMIDRTPPSPPRPLRGDADAAEKKRYELAVKYYEAQIEQFKKEQYCVVGRVPWQQPVQVLPSAWRKKLAEMKTADQAKAMQSWRDQCPEHFVTFYAGKDQVGDWKPGQARRVIGAVQAAAQIPRTPLFRSLYGVPECRYVQMDLFVVSYQLFDSLISQPEAQP